MRRFRLSTLMLLIVIASLCVALVVQHHRAARREAELQARLADSWELSLDQRRIAEMIVRLQGMLAKRQAAESKSILR
jgi:hypothetical protein